MRIRLIGLLVAVFALAAIPAISQASHGKGHAKSHGKNGNHCTIKRGWTVRGTLDTPFSYNTTTNIGDSISLLNVTSANRHARRSGVEKGEDYDVTNDPGGFKVKLVGYEGTDTPSDGDRVKLVGKISYRKKRCEDSGYQNPPNIRKAVIKDADPD